MKARNIVAQPGISSIFQAVVSDMENIPHMAGNHHVNSYQPCTLSHPPVRVQNSLLQVGATYLAQLVDQQVN